MCIMHVDPLEVATYTCACISRGSTNKFELVAVVMAAAGTAVHCAWVRCCSTVQARFLHPHACLSAAFSAVIFARYNRLDLVNISWILLFQSSLRIAM